MDLLAARKARGWSQQEVADQIGVHNSTLGRIERGMLLPSKAIARKLYRLYKGEVPLASIYDPDFRSSEELRA